MNVHRLSLVALAVVLALVAGPRDAFGASDLVLIVDASGSMWAQIEGQNKIVIARRVLGDLVDSLPQEQSVALVAYGHRREGDCEDIELVSPMAKLDRAALKKTIQALNPKGKTPITRSIQQAFEVAAKTSEATTVVLVSDGLESCAGDPCAAVRAAKESGIDFVMHVIGLDVAREDVSQLECAAQAGGGLFLSADNADELSHALDAALALPADVPPSRLSVKALADGKLHDVAIKVTDAETSEHAAGGRTYGDPGTNPRVMPLPAGRYDVAVKAMGLEGNAERTFRVELADGELLEKVVDFSTGEVSIHVTRNGELSDSVYEVYVVGTRERAATGRTYAKSMSNPAVVRITAGEYDVEIGSVEIAGKPRAVLGTVTVPPRGRAEVEHAFSAGVIEIGARRGSELVDVTVQVYGADGKETARGRTYARPESNPASWIVLPGDYRVKIREVRGAKSRQEFDLNVEADMKQTRIVELD